MNPTQLAQQILTNYQTSTGTIYNAPPKTKPIFVMRVPTQLSSHEMDKLRDGVAKDKMSDDYHIIVVPSSATEFEFEMYNADKIEVQRWNELVNRILK